MQAEHGHVFVVAASHLIFLRRQPSHALQKAGGLAETFTAYGTVGLIPHN